MKKYKANSLFTCVKLEKHDTAVSASTLYKCAKCNCEILFSEKDFYRYEMEGKQIGDNRKSFVFSENGKPVIKDLARRLETIATSETDKVEAALSYVQSLPYSFL